MKEKKKKKNTPPQQPRQCPGKRTNKSIRTETWTVVGDFRESGRDQIGVGLCQEALKIIYFFYLKERNLKQVIQNVSSAAGANVCPTILCFSLFIYLFLVNRLFLDQF